MSDFVKNGLFYRIKSKYIFDKYNISIEDKKRIDEKLDHQKDFLQNRHIITGDNSSFSLFDMSMGANIRPDKYLSELSHRVQSIKKYAESINFVPVFLTMTPESHFKPCKVIKTKKKGFYILDDNKSFTGDFDNYVIDCRDSIQEKFRRFSNDRIFRDIKKVFGVRPIGFSSYEPFLDGALHKHTLFFIPSNYVSRFISRFHYYFGSVQRDIKTEFNDDAGGVASYIMKYVLKSFRNAETGELSDEGYWYAKHGLIRFSSSRVMLPLYIWRSIRSPELSYFKMTQEYHADNLKIGIVAKHPSYHLFDFRRSDYKLSSVDLHHYEDNVYIGSDQLYKRSSDSFDIVLTDNRYGSSPGRIDHVKTSIFPLSVNINGEDYVYNGNTLVLPLIAVPFRTSLDLYKHFQTLDILDCDLNHYHYVKNELIQRGVLDGIETPLSDVQALKSWL